MNKKVITLVMAVVLISFQFLYMNKVSALQPWKQKAYANILSVSQDWRIDEVPVVKNKLNKKISFKQFINLDQKKRDYIIVLGNKPFRFDWPTLDTVDRVIMSVLLAQKLPDAMLVMTGGKTVGKISEAEQMGLIAVSRGIDPQRILLEEKAMTTFANAEITAHLLRSFPINDIYLVSKGHHLQWAFPHFDQYPTFKGKIKLVPSGISNKEIVVDMKNYLSQHDDKVVQVRLTNILKGVKGWD